MDSNVPIDKLLKDCDGLIRKVHIFKISKNGLRKVIIMLDRQYL